MIAAKKDGGGHSLNQIGITGVGVPKKGRTQDECGLSHGKERATDSVRRRFKLIHYVVKDTRGHIGLLVTKLPCICKPRFIGFEAGFTKLEFLIH